MLKPETPRFDLYTVMVLVQLSDFIALNADWSNEASRSLQ